MKRIHILFVLSLALLAAVSCLKSKNTMNYTADISFEDDALEFDPVDSTCFLPFINVGNLIGFDALLNAQEDGLLGGFCLCRGVNPVLDGTAAKTQYHCIAHPYVSGEKTFAVFYQSEAMPENHIIFNIPNANSFIAPRGVMLNNTHNFVQTVTGAGGFSENKFVAGDWAAITFTGYLDGKETGSASLRMAEFLAEEENVVTEWTLLDLSALGHVDRIDVALTSSRPGAFRYVCIDHLNLSVSLVY